MKFSSAEEQRRIKIYHLSNPEGRWLWWDTYGNNPKWAKNLLHNAISLGRCYVFAYFNVFLPSKTLVEVSKENCCGYQ
jgi:hypothetical protein